MYHVKKWDIEPAGIKREPCGVYTGRLDVSIAVCTRAILFTMAIPYYSCDRPKYEYFVGALNRQAYCASLANTRLIAQAGDGGRKGRRKPCKLSELADQERPKWRRRSRSGVDDE